MKKIFLMIVVLLGFNIELYAGCVSGGCYGVKIVRINATSGGTIYVGTSGDEKALNCAAGTGNGGLGNVYMSIDYLASGKNALYSMLLTAQTTNKTINLRVQEGSTQCIILYATLDK